MKKICMFILVLAVASLCTHAESGPFWYGEYPETHEMKTVEYCVVENEYVMPLKKTTGEEKLIPNFPLEAVEELLNVISIEKVSRQYDPSFYVLYTKNPEGTIQCFMLEYRMCESVKVAE